MADNSLTQYTTIDVDPAGDLILVVGSGDNQISIRASSKTLSSVSPVLGAMFRPNRFLEGMALSSLNPPKIYLPEDDPDAVIFFCCLVHFPQYHGQQPRPPTTQLMHLALFCDKYDAVAALHPWSELWLQTKSEESLSGDHGKLLAFAYVFDNHSAFCTSSRSAILDGTDAIANGMRDELHFKLLPDGFYGKSNNSPLFSMNLRLVQD